MARIVKVFNVFSQEDTDHEVSFASNGEMMLTDNSNGHFLKIDVRGMSKEKFDELLVAYKTANIGKITLEQVENEQNAILDNLIGPEEAQSNDAPTNTP